MFFEKVERYNNLVYLLSEYFIRHYEYIGSLDYKHIREADVHWNVYRIPVDFKQRLVEYNPQLSPEELEEEINSDAKVKKHHYTYDDPDYKLPIDSELNNPVSKRFNNVHSKVFQTLRKYNDLQSFDFYNEREDLTKERDRQAKKYVWGDMGEQNKSIDEIKKKIAKRQAEASKSPSDQ